MPTDDESLASKTENWIVTQIEAIQLGGEAAFEDIEVAAWEGNVQQNAADVAQELLSAHRAAIVRVRFRGDRAEPLDGGFQRIVATYDVFVGVENKRSGGSSRRGDGRRPGTNLMRDLFYGALHNKRPNVGANGRYSDHTAWKGCEGVLDLRGASIKLFRLEVDEVAVKQ